MKPEVWHRVTSVFHVALEKPKAERGAFLDAACSHDTLVRREVEALLASHDEAKATHAGFVDDALDVLAVPSPDLVPGRRLGPYEIEARIGAGGMGTVYRAHDVTLGRKVALKVLTGDLARSVPALLRFEQEARLASSLNHPNIVTVYAVDRQGDVPCIATELIEGETLRQRIRPGGLPVDEALGLALQVASALAAAHAAGIVHRDVKPENVMVRKDGYAKVLDFGLARPDSPSTLTTEPGLLMGTVSYMSPEQARGQRVDARSDVWSFGVVLYEMLTGVLPFPGASAADVIVAILGSEPVPVSKLRPGVPAACEAIVGRCLARDREDRYRSTDELLADLQAAAEGQDVRGIRPRAASTKHLRGLAAMTALAVLAGLGYAWHTRSRSAAPAAATHLEMATVTSTGSVLNAAVSRDGGLVAYVMQEAGGQSLWARRRDSPRPERLRLPAPGSYRGVSVAPDGRSVWYVADLENDDSFALYEIAAAGGEPRLALTSVDSPVGFSPDGRHLAFIRLLPSQETALVVSGLDGSGSRTLAVRRSPAALVEVAPAWSPDGRVLAVTTTDVNERMVRSLAVTAVDVESGQSSAVGRQSWRWVGQPAWLGDGRALIVPVAGGTSTSARLVRISFPDGATEALTHEVDSYLSVSASPGSSSLVAVKRELLSSLWVTDLLGGLARAAKVTRGEGKYYYNLSWTADGRVVCASAENGSWDLWSIDPVSGEARPLTSGPEIDVAPEVSRDGRYVFFQSNRAGSFNVWRVNADGSDPRRLTQGGGELSPLASDAWVAYTSVDTAAPSTWTVPLDGGAPSRFGDGTLRDPVVSPDGRTVAAHYRETPSSAWSMGVFPSDGSGKVPLRRLALPGAGDWQTVRWVPGTADLSYLDLRDDVSNIWLLPRQGPPRQLTRFDSGRIFSFGWSRDGRRLACIRGVYNRDVVAIQTIP